MAQRLVEPEGQGPNSPVAAEGGRASKQGRQLEEKGREREKEMTDG